MRSAKSSIDQPNEISDSMCDFQFMGEKSTGFCDLSQQPSVDLYLQNRLMETIGDRIRREREAQDMSRAELASRIGAKGESYISELELGGIKKGGRLHKIAEVLGVSVKWLETGKGPKHAFESESQSVRPSDETMAQALDLLYMLADLRPDDQRFARITWPMLQVAAKAIESKAGQRDTVSMLLSNLKETTDATG